MIIIQLVSKIDPLSVSLQNLTLLPLLMSPTCSRLYGLCFVVIPSTRASFFFSESWLTVSYWSSVSNWMFSASVSDSSFESIDNLFSYSSFPTSSESQLYSTIFLHIGPFFFWGLYLLTLITDLTFINSSFLKVNLSYFTTF